ncbi:MAG TPA: hypothetical protein PK264_01655 [Hyphomicrobiaceae bacterium]|nr:hypothetical protein [Hyphomicrobiaceae bacterium]
MQGTEASGAAVVEAKLRAIDDMIGQFLVHYPGAKPRHPGLGLVAHPVTGTPFILLDDYDDDELRLHFIVHAHANLDDLDPAATEC